MSVSTHRSAAGVAGLIRREVAITVRLFADNVLVASVPPLCFAVATALRFDLGPQRLASVVAEAVLWSVLYIYVYDASNQAEGAAEDALNKPYRPVPAGLVTVAGMRFRMVIGSVLYLVLSAWISGVALIAAAMWTATAILPNLYASPRYYLFFKPFTMLVGVAAQLAGSWEIAYPLDMTGWWWVLVIAVLFSIPLPIEDVRDMAGDRAVGRRTFALIVGPNPIRAWFIAMMLIWPLVAHLLLFRGSGAASSAISVTTAVFTALCWGTGLYTALNRTHRGNRMAYLLYSAVHLALVASALVLLT
jgi:4-hydroxybenzoate polyprenyltransferase